MKKVKCPQTKCIYNQYGGCRPCKQCKTEPNVIDESCDICWNCANDLGILRWDDNDNELTEEEKALLIKHRLTKIFGKRIVISTPSGDIK